MPTQREKGEEEKDFISRCMSETKNEFPGVSQRYAVCKSYADKSNEKMKKQDLFVLVPKKSENRGKYLARCSSHSQIKAQFSPLKERLAYCLTSFNEYYKYWTKIEAFAEVPSDTALGDCIAKEKAKGFDYKESYAHCASKVVVQPGPVVLSDDNLLVEPVEFGLEDACWEGYEAIGTKILDGKEVPNCVPIKMTEDDFADTINDYPDTVKNAAKRALDYADKNGWGGCGTDVGKQRANQLAKGENISVDTVKRMYSYLSRHKVDLQSSKSYEDGCGARMYDSWGGESGLKWAETKLKQLEK